MTMLCQDVFLCIQSCPVHPDILLSSYIVQNSQSSDLVDFMNLH